MSGHSKWANIKHKKEKADAQRGKMFTKIGREIAVAVKEGGADPSSNSKLRDVIAKAKMANMPNDNITRSIKKAAGELGTVNYEEVTYEGYAPGGVAVIVEALTDNRNRTAAEIRHIFDKSGGSLGTTGCVGWMFERKGVLIVEKGSNVVEDDLVMLAIENGADDYTDVTDAYEITCDPAEFSGLREKLEEAGYVLVEASIDMLPQNTVSPDGETAEKVLAMIEKLEDHDDVQNVFHNAEIDEEEE